MGKAIDVKWGSDGQGSAMQVDDERSADVDVDVYSSLEAKYRFYQPVPSALGRRRRTVESQLSGTAVQEFGCL